MHSKSWVERQNRTLAHKLQELILPRFWKILGRSHLKGQHLLPNMNGILLLTVTGSDTEIKTGINKVQVVDDN